jgi:exopolyphosphatase/pppGpp-phosphohydrolase
MGKLLEASAYLHDAGHYISDMSHHKHSFYLVANSDMPGFTRSERTLIAMLCRYHRKSMPTVQHDAFQSLNPEGRRAVMMLAPLLRIGFGLEPTRISSSGQANALPTCSERFTLARSCLRGPSEAIRASATIAASE